MARGAPTSCATPGGGASPCRPFACVHAGVRSCSRVLGRRVACFKPRDEEPFAHNNPRDMVGVLGTVRAAMRCGTLRHALALSQCGACSRAGRLLSRRAVW